jgi:mannosylglycerate hydrolase
MPIPRPKQFEVHFVSHTHWDREWYLSREKSRFLLVQTMDRLFTILDRDKSFRFMLDGQSLMLEDYLEIKPAMRRKLARFVRSGRISIGPWYVLPDEFLASGESHIRNYLLGSRICREFGANMNLGYLPDSFGHPSQMPQILKGLGMGEIVFWRGLGPEITRTEFEWEGLDGSSILGINTPYSYGIAACMPDDPGEFVKRLESKIELLSPLTDGRVILLMNGVDHVSPQESVPRNLRYARAKKMRGYELRHGTLRGYLAAVKRQRLPLQKTAGELRSGRRAYLLGGTLSTRMYLKQAHQRAEMLLEKRAEPLAVIAWVMFGARYPAEELRHAWRLLLSNLPHDSICGCGVDEVHEEMMQRYRWFDDLSGSLIEGSLAAMSAPPLEQAPEGGRFTVFNPLLHERDDVVRVSFVAEERLLRKVNYLTGNLDEYRPEPESQIPTGVVVRGPGGAETRALLHSVSREDTMRLSLDTQPQMFRGMSVDFSFVAKGLPPLGCSEYEYAFTYDEEQGERSPAAAIENETFSVAFQPADASLTVVDKRTGQRYEGLNAFEDQGDAGDEYTYSWPQNDSRHRLAPESVRTRVEGSQAQRVLMVSGAMRIPAGLTPDRRSRSAQLVDIAVQSRISLNEGVGRIDIETVVENVADDHRLRVLFPLGAAAVSASTEGVFSVDTRLVGQGGASGYADWVEPPSTNPQKSFVSVSAGERGLAVANRGLPDCEVLSDPDGRAVIALTLLRCVGWLSRPDLLARKGNGGWTLPTPGAQCRGVHRFAYSLIPHRGSWREGGVAALAHDFATPALAFPAHCAGAGSRGERFSFVSVDQPSIVLSALKRAEDRGSVILRCWNASEKTVSALFRFARPAGSIYRTDLAERREWRLCGRADACRVEFPPWKIVSLELVFDQDRREERVASPDDLV